MRQVCKILEAPCIVYEAPLQNLRGTNITFLNQGFYLTLLVNWCGSREADHEFGGETMTIFFSTLGILCMEDYRMKVPQ